jgi:hypothetical protein
MHCAPLIALSHINDRRSGRGTFLSKAESTWNVDPLLKELRHNRMLWLLVLVLVALVAAKLIPTAHTLLFVLSVLATRLHRLCRYSLPMAAAPAVTAQDEIESKHLQWPG